MHTLRTLSLALCVALSLVGCDEPEQDDFKSQGGISPDPSGIISGSVLYVGPRPQCEWTNGRASRIQGRVVMLMFHYNNPPPPEGRASTALNIKYLNPEELFTLSDCLPEGEVGSPTAAPVSRSIPFSWPQIVLGTGKDNVSYQIRGFYDSDEDMNPFFSVRNLPTKGDIAGGALKDLQVPEKGLLEIVMPPASRYPNGYRRQGVIVALGNYVWLERPAFKLNQYRFMSATQVVIPRQVEGSADIDIKATVQETRAATCDGSLRCGLTLEQATPEEFASTFERAGVDLDFSPDSYAFVSEPVDVQTIVQDGVDRAEPDGVPDPHPLLGSNLGVPWFTPIMIMTRTAPTPAMQEIETAAHIPNVRLIGTVMLENAVAPDGPKPAKRVTRDAIDMGVAAVAAVELDANNPLCRLPYLAPKNLTRAYESRLTYCSDMPTGIYSVSAIQGVIGGDRNEQPSGAISDNGFTYDRGRLSNQAWTTPNDLGNPAQVGEDRALASQSPSTAFVVYDRDLDRQDDCSRAADPDNNLAVRPVVYRELCANEDVDTRIENPEGTVGAGIDGTKCLPPSCCEAIEHLCDLPPCEPCTEESCPGLELGSNHPIRQGPTEITSVTKEGKSIPNCVPFPLPTLCCPKR